MRYYAEEALGMLETVGMVPALEACDKMLKAADVELISYENIGSTLVTIMIKGDVAAVKSFYQGWCGGCGGYRKTDCNESHPASDKTDWGHRFDLRC